MQFEGCENYTPQRNLANAETPAAEGATEHARFTHIIQFKGRRDAHRGSPLRFCAATLLKNFSRVDNHVITGKVPDKNKIIYLRIVICYSLFWGAIGQIKSAK